MEIPARFVTAEEVELYARLALDGIQRESPHCFERAPQMKGQFIHLSAKEATPAFYGCFDWHSAVHSHWSLIRMMRCCQEVAWARDARAAIAGHFTPANIAQEVAFFTQPNMDNFERPYGLAWLLQLVAELHSWSDDAEAQRWRETLRPLEVLSRQRFLTWLPNLPAPVRTGMHDQTAFAMGLLLDSAISLGNEELRSEVRSAALRFFENDRGANIHLEPGPYDFLSPSLAVADLMRRVLPSGEFSPWLYGFFPELNGSQETWLSPVASCDPSDGLLCHLDGLNTSRAWMLEGIAGNLAADDVRRPVLLECAANHREAGLGAIYPEHYSGAHWLGSFAVYLITQRGV